MYNNNSTKPLRQCVKCSELGTLSGLEPHKASYCKQCFIQMVKHKFASSIGKRRLYKDGSRRETLVVYEGDAPSALLICLISQGLKASANKRLTLIPTVLVLLTVNSKEAIASVRQQIESFKQEVLDAKWLFVHISAIFYNLTELLSRLNEFIGDAESISKWERLLNGCSSESVREELIRLARTLICLRIAERLGVSKVMMSDSADYLAKCALHSLAFARGSSINCLSGAVDKRHPNVTIVRPFRDISNKEIALVNRFEGYDEFVIYNDEVESRKQRQRQLSMQATTSQFVDHLQVEGFRATITTILSTSAKLQSVIQSDKRRCRFCSSMFQSELESERFCYACSSVIDEIGDDEKRLLEEIFAFTTTPSTSS